jgi:hypothetical protein
MGLAETQWAALVGHPATRSEAVRRIEAHARIGESGTIVFRYVLRADMSRVRVPLAEALGSEGRTDGLWRHTCFEAFIGTPATASYYELNFAPSRQWAIYGFNAYREGMSSPDVESPPQISVRRFDERLEIDVAMPLLHLSGLRDARRLRLALTAVIEEDSGTLSYWALRHPPGKADFHHPDGFVLELEP